MQNTVMVLLKALQLPHRSLQIFWLIRLLFRLNWGKIIVRAVGVWCKLSCLDRCNKQEIQGAVTANENRILLSIYVYVEQDLQKYNFVDCCC